MAELEEYPVVTVIDEVQCLPEIVSAVQTTVDEKRDACGQFIPANATGVSCGRVSCGED